MKRDDDAEGVEWATVGEYADGTPARLPLSWDNWTDEEALEMLRQVREALIVRDLGKSNRIEVVVDEVQGYLPALDPRQVIEDICRMGRKRGVMGEEDPE